MATFFLVDEAQTGETPSDRRLFVHRLKALTH